MTFLFDVANNLNNGEVIEKKKELSMFLTTEFVLGFSRYWNEIRFFVLFCLLSFCLLHGKTITNEKLSKF